MYVWSKLSSSQWIDAWEERFGQQPDCHLVITQVPGRKMARVELYGESAAAMRRVQKMFGGSLRKLKQQNWAAMTPEPPPPLPIRGKIVVCAARTGKEVAAARKQFAGREVIAVPADLAFGTGHHATTATVLRFLVDAAERFSREGRRWTMADLGCGTGILAIAARKLGASQVWGCDFDPQAVRVAKENLERNGTPAVSITRQDVLKWRPRKKWDCVAANIFYDILEAASHQIVAAVRPGGVLMLSGILKSQAEGCLATMQRAGMIVQKVVTRGKWVTALGSVARSSPLTS